MEVVVVSDYVRDEQTFCVRRLDYETSIFLSSVLMRQLALLSVSVLRKVGKTICVSIMIFG